MQNKRPKKKILVKVDSSLSITKDIDAEDKKEEKEVQEVQNSMYSGKDKDKKEKKYKDIYKDEYMRENRSWTSKLLFTYIYPLLKASQEEEITHDHYGKLPDRLKIENNAHVMEQNMLEFSKKYPGS